MHSQIFVNLPVKDLKRSVDFFTKLGYTFNPTFTDENATCMILGDNLFVMLLVEKFFASFTNKGITDTSEDHRSADLRRLQQPRAGRYARRQGARRRREGAARTAGPRLHVRPWLRRPRRPHLGAHPHDRRAAKALNSSNS